MNALRMKTAPVVSRALREGAKRYAVINVPAAYLESRSYSTTRPVQYSFDNGSSNSDGTGMMELSRWPITKTNTILNIVPQGKRFVVERFGKLSDIHDSGYFFAIPVIDQIAYVIDIRERAIDIEPQSAITRDNVSVEVSGNLFIQFIDSEKAAYGARNPLYSVVQVSLYFLINLKLSLTRKVTLLEQKQSMHNLQ